MKPLFTIYPHLTPEDRKWFSDHPETTPPQEAVTALKAVLEAGHPSTAEDLAKLACAFQYKQDRIEFEQQTEDLRNEIVHLKNLLKRATDALKFHGVSTGLVEEIYEKIQ